MAVFKKEREELKGSAAYRETPTEVTQSQSIIGKTLFIKGDIIADEELMVEGKIEGKLIAKHRVIVAKEGLVNADIDGKEVVIKGRVNGNIKCSYKVEIVPGGTLNGNIKSEKVVLAEGAVFKGNINMTIDSGDTAKGIPNKYSEKKEIKEKKEPGKD